MVTLNRSWISRDVAYVPTFHTLTGGTDAMRVPVLGDTPYSTNTGDLNSDMALAKQLLIESNLTNDELLNATHISGEARDGEVMVMVAVDLAARAALKSEALVKKTVSIPSYLNQQAQDAGLNFSQVLRDGLQAKLQEREENQ